MDARRFEVRVRAVVPRRWSIHYTREDDDVEEALDSVVPRALRGADLMDLCPRAFTVSCDADDLVMPSAPMRASELSMRDHEGALLFGRRLTEALLDRKEEEIVAELSARRERDALLRLATGPADALAGPLLEQLSSSVDPETETLALRRLDVPEALSAALTYLGRFGGREVVAPLRGRLTRGGARQLESDVELCIELVQDHLQGERGAPRCRSPPRA